MILSLYARGMTMRDIEAHLREVYGISASRELISKVTEVVADEVELWRNRPVDECIRSSTWTGFGCRSGTRVR